MKKLIMLAALVVASPALAKWKAQYVDADPRIIKWYSDQHNANGGWCCDQADGHDFYDSYTLNPDGSVDFDTEGKHFHLDKELVLTGPNPTGHAVWWYVDRTDGSRASFCFAAGAGG